MNRDHWVPVRLGDIGTWFGGGTPSKSRAEYWQGGTIPWISPKDMGPMVLTGTQDHVTEAAVRGSSTRMIPAGSVAIVVRSGILERTVPIAIVPFAATLNQDMKAVAPVSDVDPRWVAWGMRAAEQRILAECRKAGTTVASIETSRLMDLAIPVPPRNEQEELIDLLEDRLGALEGVVQALESVMRRERLLRQGLLAATFDKSEAEEPDV